MLKTINAHWAMLLFVNAALWCVLGFYGSTTAAPQGAQQPFANAVQQRAEMVRQMQEISALLKEQNALLKTQNALLGSGKLHVNVSAAPDPQ